MPGQPGKIALWRHGSVFSLRKEAARISKAGPTIGSHENGLTQLSRECKRPSSRGEAHHSGMCHVIIAYSEKVPLSIYGVIQVFFAVSCLHFPHFPERPPPCPPISISVISQNAPMTMFSPTRAFSHCQKRSRSIPSTPMSRTGMTSATGARTIKKNRSRPRRKRS